MIQMEKLISIITPTYNYGHLIHRLLDSILQQTYSNIEMFVIDDGSTDNTKQVVEGYIAKFQKKGFTLNYVYQENQKLAKAINNGLKLITGEYLVWPDADDWYATPNALETMATTLDDTNDEISCCRSLVHLIDENFVVAGKIEYKNITGKIFRDYLLGNNIMFVAGCFMVKTDILFKEIDNRTIYSENFYHGQNRAILLPILYNYKAVTVNKYLFCIFQNNISDSRKKRLYNEQIERSQSTCSAVITILESIKKMPDEEKSGIILEILEKYHFSQLRIHFSSAKMKETRRSYKQMIIKNMNIPKKAKIFYLLSFVPYSNNVYGLLLSVNKKLIRLGLRKR